MDSLGSTGGAESAPGEGADSTPNWEVASCVACFAWLGPEARCCVRGCWLFGLDELGAGSRSALDRGTLGAGECWRGVARRAACRAGGDLAWLPPTRSTPPTPGPITPVRAQAASAPAQAPVALPSGPLAAAVIPSPSPSVTRAASSRARPPIATEVRRSASAAEKVLKRTLGRHHAGSDEACPSGKTNRDRQLGIGLGYRDAKTPAQLFHGRVQATAKCPLAASQRSCALATGVLLEVVEA